MFSSAVNLYYLALNAQDVKFDTKIEETWLKLDPLVAK